MSRTLKIAGKITLLLLLAAFSMAAANAQTYPKPTNVTAENTTDGYVLVSWADDAAPVHRVGWTHDADFRAAEAAGDWLEAFHFADSKRDTDYTIKYLPRGQQYWFIVGTTNERFTGATYSEWTSITTTADSTTPTPMPAATPTPMPAATPTPMPAETPTPMPAATPTPMPMPTATLRPTATRTSPSTGIIKKSRSGICHAPGTTYYSRTLIYTPYATMAECLASGGRLPGG